MRILTIFCAAFLLTVLHSTSLFAQDDILFNDEASTSDDELFGSDDADDDLFDDEDTSSDDNLFGDSDAAAETSTETKADEAGASHLALFAEERYPSANTCKTCHEKHYQQWSVSQHAYAQLSPVYMAMQNRINQLTSGTNGDFCIRCHTQVGMNLGESTSISNLDRHPTSREGITCVVCHRLDKNYGKVSGRIALVEGDLLSPVFGPNGNEELERVLDNRNEFRVVTDADKPGRKIHTEVGHFPALSTSGFCGTCHDVNLHNGFRLEEAFSEYKNSPAAEAKQSCQDCHMGKVQGLPSGYDHGPAAVVGGVATQSRKLTNHFFAGPDYSVVHPGIFPHNSDAAQMATLREWLKFDVDAGWGTDEFENSSRSDIEFPARWRAIDDRYDAREIIDYQLQQLEWASEKRLEVLRNGYGLGELTLESASRSKGLKFYIDVHNLTDGHNVPTGFDAERLVWLGVELSNKEGDILFSSGDLDPNGDLRDAHSLYVHNRELPLDKDLFSLQSKFLTRMIRGGEREQVLAVNYSADPLPFIRPDTRSTMLHGQPAGARKHRFTIPPRSKRRASYSVPAKDLKGEGPFKIKLRLNSAMVPVNLIAAIQDVGFDYDMSAKQLADKVVEGHQTLRRDTVTIYLTE
ncbi:MAG: multiheme c-type cytochrome [Pseudomonadales bacterium]